MLYWCFSFWLTSFCIGGSSFTHLIRTDSNAFFSSWVIFHCVYVPQLSYKLICHWTSRLLPCPSYCKQCCNEQWATCVSFNSGFFSVYAQQWDCWVVWRFYFQFLKESLHCSPWSSRSFDEQNWRCEYVWPNQGFNFYFVVGVLLLPQYILPVSKSTYYRNM